MAFPNRVQPSSKNYSCKIWGFVVLFKIIFHILIHIFHFVVICHSDIAEDEQLIRRNLMSLHRAVNQKDRILLSQLTQAGIDMTLPLKGVTALSLSLYLKYKEMTVEILEALKQTRQISKLRLDTKRFYFNYEYIIWDISC